MIVTLDTEDLRKLIREEVAAALRAAEQEARRVVSVATQAESTITYAKVGGPPADWHGLRVFDLDTGQEVLNVREVNTVEGWLESHRVNGLGHAYLDPDSGDRVATQIVRGRFEIRRR